MALEEINNGDSGAIAAAKIFNNDKKAAALKWTTADAGAVYPTIRVEAGVLYQVIDGQTATTVAPSLSPAIWVSLGSKAFEGEFQESNKKEASTMHTTAKYFNTRMGVEIIDPDNPSVTLTQADAQTNNAYLSTSNTLIPIAGNTSFAVRNFNTEGAIRLTATGYILKDGSLGSAGILGIKENGDIVNLTIAEADYAQLDHKVYNISEFVRISLCMAAGFTVEIDFGGELFPPLTDYFTTKEGLSEIFGRMPNRYISDYQGSTVLQVDWECSVMIRVEAGDKLEAEGTGWSFGMAMYAIYDINKKWIRSGGPAPTNGATVKTNLEITQEGYVIFCSRTIAGGKLKVFLNKASKNKFEELNQKLEFTDTKELDFTTPTSLADARFFEPYIDTGGVLKTKVPTTVKDKIVLNDEPFILEDRYVGEHSFVKFNGRVLVYYTEAIKTGQEAFDIIGIMSVGMLDPTTGKHTYLQQVIHGGVSDVPAGYNVHRSHAFVKDSQVYIVATVESPDSSVSQIWMFKSSDGYNFTKVKVISNSGFGFVRFGNLWLVTEQVDGYYYFYYEGFTSGIWSVKIARSTTLEGDYTYYQNVTGPGAGGAVGGICVIYYADKFRMWYHYGIGGNLPTYLGYAESPKATPGTFTVINQPFLALDNSPIGPGTDQNGDFALLEIDGSIWAGYQYAINAPILSGVWCWKKLNGLTYAKLFT